jgi:mannose-6-phosphate isomerase-like protein (cupin superfamily)
MLESDTNTWHPKLAFSPPQDDGRGINVLEIELARAGKPLAPFNAARFTVAPGCASIEESHAVHELWMIVAGEGELIYDGRPLRVRSSDVLYFEPPKTHQVRNDGAETMEVISLWWKS